MAKLTLLDMVQDIMNDMDSDEVNDITDTVESAQVAQIVKTTYFKIVTARDDWPFLRTLTTLTGLGDTSNPTKMQIPDGMNKVYWVRYNKKPVSYMEPADFKDMIDGREEQEDVIDENGYGVSADPLYWTSYDDTYIHFDSYDVDEDTTLQTSKSAVYGILVPSWTHSNAFVPTLPEKMFPTLLASAKGTAFLVLKQQGNAKEESYAERGLIRHQNSAYRADNAEPTYNKNVNYGRK